MSTKLAYLWNATGPSPIPVGWHPLDELVRVLENTGLAFRGALSIIYVADQPGTPPIPSFRNLTWDTWAYANGAWYRSDGMTTFRVYNMILDGPSGTFYYLRRV